MTTTNEHETQIRVWWDEQSGVEPGWAWEADNGGSGGGPCCDDLGEDADGIDVAREALSVHSLLCDVADGEITEWAWRS